MDVAGGRGVDAVVLASHGLETTVVDISPVALADVEPPVRAIELDLETEPLPPGPWDVISCFHYLQRDLFPGMVESLAIGGMLVVVVATRTNLRRHDRPSARWLLDDGELPGLVTGLQVVRYEEGWSDPLDATARHEARILARKGTGKGV